MVSLEHAVETLKNSVNPVARAMLVPLEQASGRISAAEVFAEFDIPPFDRSSLDGYALRSADVANASTYNPAKLKVAAEIPAGSFWDGALRPGQAARIMTGGMIPNGADCVVKQENTDDGDAVVSVYSPVKSNENIGFKGEDIKNGSLILPKGASISYAHLGLLASAGHSRVAVMDKVRCGLLSTGDELILPGEQLPPGKIYSSNLFMLAGRMGQLGANVTAMRTARDDAGEVCEIIEREIDGVDILFTTGGVSVGRRDILHSAVERLRAEKLFWKVALKPGASVLAAKYREKLLLCLSGNPFASLTALELIGRPALSWLSGDESINCGRAIGIMSDSFPKPSPERRFVRAFYENGKVTFPAHYRSSGSLMSLIGCNSLIDIPAGSPPLSPGDRVELVLL